MKTGEPQTLVYVAKKPGNGWEIRLGRRAERQFGHITRQQVLESGLSRGWLEGRIAAGYLIPVHAGVYAVGVRREDVWARAMAAVLACGPDALLSHAAAAGLWGIREWPRIMEVTVPTGRKRPGIRIHRCTTLTRKDRRTHNGIRVTSPARTVLDLSPRLTDKQRARAVNEARLHAGLKLAHLADTLDRHPRHPGTPLLRPFIQAPTGPTRSEFEDAFLAFTRRFGLPTPLFNQPLHGYEVDALFPEHRVIVEMDGWDFHCDRTAFATDRERDAHHLEHGHVTVRLTWERLHETPEREAARLHRILDQTYGLLGEEG